MTTAYKDKTQSNNGNEQNNENLNSITFSGGEKGGVGKSFFMRCLLNYFVDKQWESQFLLIEADPTISDVSFVYKEGYEKAVFSDNKFDCDEPNVIIDKVPHKSTIVNLPSNVSRQFDEWMVRIGVLSEQVRKYYNEINYFFVTDGCFQSVQQFISHLDKYPEFNNCLVLNTGRLTCGGNFRYLEKHKPLIEKIKEHQIPIIALPELSSRFQFDCDRQGLSYSDFLNRQDTKITAKAAIGSFIKQLEKLFGKIYPHRVSSAEGLKDIAQEQVEDRKKGKIAVGEKDPKTRTIRLF